jgi:glyoxylase-like metal-dependent hydrolase (beta-lactamase superfamily II)
MELKQISASCYYFAGKSVNVGYVLRENKGMLIDSGLDDATAKKIIKILKNNNLPLTHLFLTHAHADHYGGANFLQRTYQLHTIAPSVEEALMKYPQLNSMMMFQGNDELKELKNKFLQGKSVKINTVCTEGHHVMEDFPFEVVSLPGHSHNQCGLIYENVLFAADAYFSEEAINKHKIPFIVDAEATFQTFDKLLTLQFTSAVPGHGVVESDISKTVKKNREVHHNIYRSIVEIIEKNPLTIDELVAEVCCHWNVKVNEMLSFVLYRTSVCAYVVKALNDKEVMFSFDNNKLFLHVNETQ